MVKYKVVFKGFILSILIAVILNILGFVSVLGLPSFMLAFLFGGIFVGYISYGRIFNGFINGALMGAAGAVILGIISLFTSQISSLTFYIPSSSIQTSIILIVLGSIGGAIGALILRLTRKNRKNRKYDRKIIEDRDRRDDLFWRD